MPRDSHAIADNPFDTWAVTVDEYNRVRLPLKVSAVVRWINQESKQVECVGKPGPWGGIQIVPLAGHQEDVGHLTEAIAEKPPSVSESAKKWVEVARFLATAWRITINVEPSRISFTLPEAPRRAEQVPSSGGTVVVFGFGDILEVWDAPKWHEHVRATAKTKDAAISAAIEDLGQR